MSSQSMNLNLQKIASQKLQSNQYTSFQISAPDKKTEELAYIILHRIDSDLSTHYFDTPQDRDRYIYNHLLDFEAIDIKKIFGG